MHIRMSSVVLPLFLGVSAFVFGMTENREESSNLNDEQIVVLDQLEKQAEVIKQGEKKTALQEKIISPEIPSLPPAPKPRGNSTEKLVKKAKKQEIELSTETKKQPMAITEKFYDEIPEAESGEDAKAQSKDEFKKKESLPGTDEEETLESLTIPETEEVDLDKDDLEKLEKLEIPQDKKNKVAEGTVKIEASKKETQQALLDEAPEVELEKIKEEKNSTEAMLEEIKKTEKDTEKPEVKAEKNSKIVTGEVKPEEPVQPELDDLDELNELDEQLKEEIPAQEPKKSEEIVLEEELKPDMGEFAEEAVHDEKETTEEKSLQD